MCFTFCKNSANLKIFFKLSEVDVTINLAEHKFVYMPLNASVFWDRHGTLLCPKSPNKLPRSICENKYGIGKNLTWYQYQNVSKSYIILIGAT